MEDHMATAAEKAAQQEADAAAAQAEADAELAERIAQTGRREEAVVSVELDDVAFAEVLRTHAASLSGGEHESARLLNEAADRFDPPVEEDAPAEVPA